MVCVHYELVHVWHPSLLKDAFDAIRWPNLQFHLIFGQTFLLVWGVTTDDRLFVASVYFFFPFFSLFQRKYTRIIFSFDFLISVLVILLLIFMLGPFIKVFYVFNLVFK
jgi:hypothetical protein